MASANARTEVAGRPLRVARPLGPRLTGLLSFLGFLLVWQAIVSITDIQEILLPSPGDVAAAFVEIWDLGLLWPAVVNSLQALIVGLIAGIALGVVLGLLIGSSAWLDLIAAPYLWGFFATPRIATAPLIILWLGFGFEAKALLVFISTLLPVIISCKEGVQTVDENLVKAARSFGANRLDLFRRVVIPYTLPFIANGVRNGIARGFVGLLIIEMTVGSGGIGTQVMRSMRQFDTARMFAFIAVLVVTALVLITLSRKLEAYASRWREEVYV
jgi:ABC-type nitrate/sulfonate/bicarbonate transport system permease component